MAIEVINAKLFVEEAELLVAQKALDFVLAGAGIGLGEEAWKLVEAVDKISVNVRLDKPDASHAYPLEITDITDSGYAGLLFIGDDEHADDFDQRLADPKEHQLYGGEFWPTLLEFDGKSDGIVSGEATIVVSGYKAYGESIANEVKVLTKRSHEGDERLTVPALKQYLASLR